MKYLSPCDAAAKKMFRSNKIGRQYLKGGLKNFFALGAIFNTDD